MLQLGYFIWIITNVQNDNFKLKIICIVYRMWSQRSTDKSPQLSFIGEYKCVSNYIWSKSDDQWSEKKIDKGSHGVKLSWRQGREPRTSLPQWLHHPAEAHSPSYSLMQQLNCCKRTEESTTLDPQWCHQSLPNCNPTCNAAWKDIHIPLLGCAPKWQFITTAKSYQHPTTTQVDPLNENWNMWKSRKK